MASSTTTGAVYGTGIYGTAEYGVVNISVVPDGVQVSATADTDIIISGDALHNITSVVGTLANGGVGAITAGANASLAAVSVEATGAVGDTEVLNNARPTFDGVVGTLAAGTVVVTADAPVSVTAPNRINTGVDQVIVTADSNYEVSGTEGTVELGTLGQLTVNRVEVTGIEATGTIDTGFVAANNACPTFDSVTGTSSVAAVGDYVVIAKAVVPPTGVSTTGQVNASFTFVGGANVVLNVSARGTEDIGTVSVSETQNVFDVANRSALRATAKVPPTEPRIIYIGRAA